MASICIWIIVSVNLIFTRILEEFEVSIKKNLVENKFEQYLRTKKNIEVSFCMNIFRKKQQKIETFTFRIDLHLYGSCSTEIYFP